MKIKSGYTLRNVLDTNLVIGIGAEAFQPNCIMSLNETGAFLWNVIKDGTDESDLVTKLVSEYEVDEETAKSDVAAFIGQLRAKDLIES